VSNVKKQERHVVLARPSEPPGATYDEPVDSGLASIGAPRSRKKPPTDDDPVEDAAHAEEEAAEDAGPPPEEEEGTEATAGEDAAEDAAAAEDDASAEDGPDDAAEMAEPLQELGVQELDPNEIEIDSEFSSMTSAPVVEEDESLPEHDRELKQQLKEYGSQVAIVGWSTQGRTIAVTGYRELLFCKELGIPIRVRLIAFSDHDAAAEFRARHRLALPSVTATERKYMIGRRYNLLDKRQGTRNDRTSGHAARKLPAAKRLGSQLGLDERTVRRHGTFAKAVDKLARANPTFRQLILSEQVKIPQQELEKLAEGAVDREVVKSIVDDKKYTPAPADEKKAGDPLRPILAAWRDADWATRGSFLLGLLDDEDDVEVLETLGVAVSRNE
jgi:hypothetical protein